jgi:ligand-binding sensor domain-containing protein/signal transduction histidine kinase
MAVRGSLGCGLGLTLLTSALLCADQLPVKTYTTADGLSRNGVYLIVQDARGFLWFGTEDGLSRFDGYTFTNYGPEVGLPKRRVTALQITQDGIYWVGTPVGLFRFNPNSPPPQKFDAVRIGVSEHARFIEAMIEDRSGALWVGTHDGVYRLPAGNKSQFEPVEIGIPKGMDGTRAATSLMEDRQGSLWIAADGLYRRMRDGRVTAYFDAPFKPGILTIYQDRWGTLWAGLALGGLCRLNPNTGPNGPIAARVYTMKDGLPGSRIEALLGTSDGRFWAGAAGGLGVYVAGADRFESYTTANGLSDPGIKSLAEDHDGNLWVGAEAGGIMRIARQGFTSYTLADGLTGTRIASLFSDQGGDLCAQTSAAIVGGWSLDCFDGSRFKSIHPRYPGRIGYFGWGWNQTVLQDHTGEWWMPTGQGLCRFGRAKSAKQLAGRVPKAVYTTNDGLPSNDIFRLFEDSRGDIWLSTAGQTHNPLTKWERATGRFHVYSEADGLPRIQSSATAFAEDQVGNVWIGWLDGGLARFRNGSFTRYAESDGVPTGQIASLYLDRAGRLWIGSSRGGLARMENLSDTHPRLAIFTTAQSWMGSGLVSASMEGTPQGRSVSPLMANLVLNGLSSNAVRCITEDQWGRIYVCTARGVDRLDPITGRIRHYTTADGLTRGDLNVARRDQQGALWFGSLLGLSRLEPQPDRLDSAPPVFITDLQVRGASRPLAVLGQTNLSGLVFGPNQNQIRLDFIGLGFAPGELLRYQYRLEGLDRDWSAPTEQRSVNYASLPPGSYRFQVRAVNSEGTASPEPAAVTLTILTPVWQRWWSLAIAGTVLALLAFAFHSYRVAQLLAVERMRARIATDLHDDIGASLSQIAILSEVARRRIENADMQAARPLSDIAAVSSELVDAMSDIVWAINPKHDHLGNLEYRLRRFANDVLGARNVNVDFRATAADPDLRVDANLRRQVLLIFKESVNNIARHSGADQATVEFTVAEDSLLLRVVDNGTGFDPAAADNGNGLANIRKRAFDLAASMELESILNQGTTLALRVPLGNPYWGKGNPYRIWGRA